MLTWRSNLAFHWAIAVDGEIHESDVHIRADHAAERGVPFPEVWHNAIRASDLDSRAREAGCRLKADDGVSEISCVLVGVPKDCRVLSDGDLCPGAVIPLSTPASGRVNFVLCAHIDGNMWYLHAGSFGVSKLGSRAGGCLDESGLVIKDIVADGCHNERPAKRIKTHARSSQLRDLIDASPCAWRTLVAIATVKAEVKRAELHTRDPAWNLALAGFQSNPWRWEVVEGWASQAKVFFLWRWRDRSCTTCSYELTCQQLHNLLARGDVPLQAVSTCAMLPCGPVT